MSAPPNLADPDVEPTDEELIGLATRAFADVAAGLDAAQEKMRAEIALGRERVLRHLDEVDRRRAGVRGRLSS